MINAHSISNMDQIVRKMIFNCEGISYEPENIGDHTVTYGYGYTFIRRGDVWRAYGSLRSIWSAVRATKLSRMQAKVRTQS